ncbi:MAG: ribosome maturation factor RimP [Nitrospinae bacterium]|nr:ribosome maturation factor RimP [Nitrospinota bacterium]
MRELLGPVLEREGVELYDLTMSANKRNSLFRIYINKPGGVTLAHCEAVSNQLSAVLDVEDMFPGSYTLEVSSPGLTRKLTKKEHFLKSAGSYAVIAFKKGFAGGLSEVSGFLENREDGGFRVRLDAGKTVDFNFDDVARAKLDLEPGKEI